MTTFNWDCKTVDVYPAAGDNTNVVYNVHWRLTGTSDQTDADGNPYTATVIGTQVLDTENITDFVAFEQLTNEQVATWVEDAMGTDEITLLQQNIELKLSKLITPTSVTLTLGA